MISTPVPPTKQVGLLVKLAVAAGAVLVALGLCEIAARVAFEAPPDPAHQPQIFYQADPDVGFLHVPNQHGWLDDGLATINALGLRGPLPEMPKPPDSVRILAIGDSTTFGWGVNDDGTYCAQLERRLQAANPGRRLSVVNGGVGAFDLEHEIRLLRHFAPKLQPDIVLVGVYWNDLPYEASAPDAPAPARGVSKPAVISPRGGSKPFQIGNQPSRLNRILRRSRLLYVLRQAWLSAAAPTAAASNLVQWEMAVLEGREGPAIDAGWKDIARGLQEIRTMGEAGGFAVGVVIMPIRAQVERSYPQARYQTVVGAMAKSLGLFVVDPLPYFARHPEPAHLFIPYDRMHFSARGNALVAEAAFETLQSRLTHHVPDAP